MSSRSRKRETSQQEITEIVSSNPIALVLVQIVGLGKQDTVIAGPFCPKSPKGGHSVLEKLRASINEDIPSEIKNLLVESQ